MHKQGATRYQKFLKSEKAKTKLKGKKDLPKGTNVTKTNFKVKKIIIQEQLKKHGQTEALSSKKLNAKELLSRLSHFNTNARMEALNGLKELITLHTDSLEVNLGQFIHGVTPLILNIEKNVRRESIKVVHLVLTHVSTDKIDPFLDVLSTYLRSAMTHIDSRIQEDSLLFLDVLLLCTPQLIAHDFHKIIPNFLDMISKLKDTNQGRTLIVNLNSQITSVKWRVKVFYRLQQFLHKFAECNDVYKIEQLSDKTHVFDIKNKNNFPLFNPIYTSVCTVSCFSSKTTQNVLISGEEEKFQSYLETLMPLMFDIWLEARPNVKGDKNIETVINEDAAILLKHILDVISIIWELVEYFNKTYPRSLLKNSFIQKYKSLFSQHFVAAFPYVTNVRSRLPKTDLPFESTIKDPKLIIENLEICYLYISINPNLNIKNNQKDITAIFNYIENNFTSNSQGPMLDVAIKVMNKIISEEISSNWTNSLYIVEPLFRKMISTYCSDSSSTYLKQQMFSLLFKMYLNNNLVGFHSNAVFVYWLHILPEVLLESTISSDIINILHRLAVSNNKSFNNVVKPKLTDIITNLPKITISDSTQKSSYYKLFSILYWINSWDAKSFELLENQIMNNEYKSDYGQYILDTLKSRGGIID
ncbi:Testis-expressed sequence 10 protein-like [Papilio xuthus]|uniref:Testis-expressed sequence 10 protein-like n=1 Tax=Papilio xuthus TaxID=66420 RepID=A0A194PSQ7_PAPXU|nr:Testis-expressed sequence 10 protein-like [Papilio xuthus]